MHVGIIAGTGPLGRGLTVRLAAAGHTVTIGSRDKGRAESVRRELTSAWPDIAGDVRAGENPAASSAELVVVAAPWDAVTTSVASLGVELRGKVLVSVANALTRQGRELVALAPARGSIAAALQWAVPDAMVAAACHHLPADTLQDLNQALTADVLVCSDYEEATVATMALLEGVSGLRPIDAGSLASAGPIESFTAVLVNVNRRYKTQTTLLLGGLENDGETRSRVAP